MRTTITLDEDVATALREAAREQRVPFKEALNAAVRRGLARRETQQGHYTLPTFQMGVRAGADLDKANQLAADMEDEAIIGKLDLRK